MVRTVIFILFATSPIITVVVLPMLINKTTEIHFDWAKRYLRELWWGVLVYYTILCAVVSSDFREIVVEAKRGFGVNYPRLSFVAAGVIGAVVFIGYWWIVGKVIPIKATASSKDSTQATAPDGTVDSSANAPSAAASEPKAIPPKRDNQQAKASPPLVGAGASVNQRSEGPNSPNVIGNNNQFNFGTGVSYDFNGGHRTIVGGSSSLVVGPEVMAYQQMVALEKDQEWQKVVDLAEMWMAKTPQWLGPYVFAADGYYQLGNRNKAVELFDYVDKHAPAYDTDYDAARNNLKILKGQTPQFR